MGITPTRKQILGARRAMLRAKRLCSEYFPVDFSEYLSRLNGLLKKAPVKKYIKRSSVSFLKKELIEPFHRWIKVRDSVQMGNKRVGSCISCSRKMIVCMVRDGRVIWNQDAQAGHFFRKKIFEALRFEPDNVHLQCSHCNGPLGGNEIKYKERLLNKITPYAFEKMELRKRNRIRYSPYILGKNIETYRAKVKEAEDDLLRMAA